MILLLALFLVVARRRDDLLIQSRHQTIVRHTSTTYNLDFVNSCLTIFSAVILVAYIMYTVSPEAQERFNTNYLFITTIFVLAGIMRYLQIAYVEQNSGSPTRLLLTDRFIIICIAGWILSFYVIIYVS
jgi:decaprenyl-phosphate phosphoribosyltransferase